MCSCPARHKGTWLLGGMGGEGVGLEGAVYLDGH